MINDPVHITRRSSQGASTLRVLEYIIEYKTEHDGNSPSMREICAATLLASTSTVNYHLTQLIKMGRIRTFALDKQSRSIEVVGGKWSYHAD